MIPAFGRAIMTIGLVLVTDMVICMAVYIIFAINAIVTSSVVSTAKFIVTDVIFSIVVGLGLPY